MVFVEVGTRMLEAGRHLGWMAETPPSTVTSAEAMRGHIDQHGYMLLRQLVPREAVAAGCRALAVTLRETGWLDRDREPEELVLGPAPPGGGFMLQAQEQDRMMDSPAVRRVLAGPELMGLFRVLFGGEQPATLDFKWFRSMCPGQASGFHMDYCYMGKGSTQLHSVWLPWHDCDTIRGGLVVLEQSNSHPAFQGVRETYGMHDYEHSNIDTGVGNTVPNSGWFGRDPAELLAFHDQARWVTAERYEAGDVVVFPMHTMHGTVTNTTGRETHSPPLLRLSCDIRFQPASAAVDPRHTIHGGPWNRAEFAAHAAAHAAAAPGLSTGAGHQPAAEGVQSIADAKRAWGVERAPLPLPLAPARAWPPLPWRRDDHAAVRAASL